jgi:hypothetical protein
MLGVVSFRSTVQSCRCHQLPPPRKLDVRPSAPRNRWLLRRLAIVALGAPRLAAQQPAPAPLPLIGGEADERLRLGQLRGDHATGSGLLRSVSRTLPWMPDTLAVPVRVLAPELHMVANSALPLSLNDGPMHAGRGVNVMATGGVELRSGVLRLVVAPQLIVEQNLAFQVIHFPQAPANPRSVWANPFHPLPESIDLPLRFGDASRLRLDPGQSSITVQVGGTEVGAATENLWWGPGIRNAIVLSNNAAGFPHVLARSREPLTTRYGAFEFDVVLGRLGESEYFDADGGNNSRAVQAGALVWHPPGTTGLHVGLTRLRISGSGGHDQMSSLFGRWLFPSAGFETYAEWARFADPAGLRDFLEYPHHSQGYTVGLQWARPLDARRTFRLQAEVSYLEPSASLRLRPVMTSYTSDRVPQGFTNKGEVLGASIGPGSSSQWLAGDVFASAWRVGLFAARIRNDNGTLYEPIVPGFKLQDVSILGGVRLSRTVRGVYVSGELTDTARLNYLYQAYLVDPIATTSKGVDIGNRTLSLIVSSAPRS